MFLSVFCCVLCSRFSRRRAGSSWRLPCHHGLHSVGMWVKFQHFIHATEGLRRGKKKSGRFLLRMLNTETLPAGRNPEQGLGIFWWRRFGIREELEAVLGCGDGCGPGAELPVGSGALGAPHRRAQPVLLWAHHPQDVPGPALQQHLHAQPPQPLRPANCSSGHGGKTSLLSIPISFYSYLFIISWSLIELCYFHKCIYMYI